MQTIGIDFGTTNSVAAVKSRVVPVPSEDDTAILPSVVAFPPSGTTVVGTAARRRRAIDSRNTIFSSKRLVGRSWVSSETEEFRSRYPFDFVQTEAGAPAFKTRAGVFTPEDIAAFVLVKLLENSPVSPGEARAVVAVPSGYARPHREATASAARKAGLVDVALVDEPVATAAAYLAPYEELIERAVVYDLGGGTFDVAVVDCTERPFRVLARGGDLYLGGDDIDRAIASWAAEQVARLHRWDLRSDPVVWDRLVVECERAKIRLCYAKETRIELAQVDPAAPAAESSIALGQDMLAQLSLELVQRTFIICDAVLNKANVRAQEVGAVFLAGGATQSPMVQQAVTQYFSRTPRAAFDPMEVVAIGASVMGTLLF